MSVGTFDQPRKVSVLAPGGRRLAHAYVTKSKELRFPIRFRRKVVLRIQGDPGPQSISETTGVPDPRSVGLSVGRASVSFDARSARGPRPGEYPACLS